MKKITLPLIGVLALGLAACAPELSSAPPVDPVGTTSVSTPWPIPQAPDPGPGPWAVCEIVTAANDAETLVGVYGATNHPRGTTFALSVDADGQTQTVGLAAKAGSIVVHGMLYGHRDPELDDGTNTNFGNTSENMVSIPRPHGAVSAQVTLGGEQVCSL